ncbi:alpha/beta fold hydrolase [Nonomuraea basaltis]|uniref:alpha/beta fold hydrolase n=1 Tax=Nonomuraea basaltis TaxID=2495887 RepID=UPI0014868A93|nr:hypothetical protein [Nonomuraea basaltis]
MTIWCAERGAGEPVVLLCARHLAGELPRGRLVELEWAGHLPALERPEEINRLLLDYL